MIIQENFITPDGTVREDLIRTYSDEGKYILQNGNIKYAEAIDLKERIDNGTVTYTESDELIEQPQPEEHADEIIDVEGEIIEPTEPEVE